MNAHGHAWNGTWGRVLATVLVAGIALAEDPGDGVAFGAGEDTAKNLAGAVAEKVIARAPGGSSTASVERGRFVPWAVVASDGGKVGSPVVGSLDDGPVLLLDESIARVRERGWVSDPSLSRGISFDLNEGPEGRPVQGALRGHLTKVAGQREGSAVAVVESTRGITVQDVFVLPPDGGAWRKWLHFWSGADRRFVGVDVWRGRALALTEDDGGYRFEIDAAAGAATPPTPRPAAQASPSCRTAIRPSRFVTTSAGAVAVVGASCDQSQAVGVEVWPTGDGIGVVHLLPSRDSLEVNALEARTINEIFVGGCAGGATPRPFIAHLRGDKWQIPPSPPGNGCVQRLTAGSRGDLWAVTGELERGRLSHARLSRLPPSGRTWRPVDVPSPWSVPSQVIDVVAFDGDSADDVWLTVTPQIASNKKVTAPRRIRDHALDPRALIGGWKAARASAAGTFVTTRAPTVRRRLGRPNAE